METARPCTEKVVRTVAEERAKYPYPVNFRAWPERFATRALGILFPHFAKSLTTDVSAIGEEIAVLRAWLTEDLALLPETRPIAAAKADEFVAGLCEIREALMLDATAVYMFDPAAESVDQVIFSYPGFLAIAIYRLAHALRKLDVPLLPRMLSEYAHRESGIDIHPGAEIGSSFFIDHGTGIVIGETAVIGEGVKLYQGVTLGALQVHKRLAGTRRHPTIGDNVVVYAHATILGDIEIGSNSVIGGNTWTTQSVPPNTVVTNRSAVRRVADPNQSDVSDFSI